MIFNWLAYIYLYLISAPSTFKFINGKIHYNFLLYSLLANMAIRPLTFDSVFAALPRPHFICHGKSMQREFHFAVCTLHSYWHFALCKYAMQTAIKHMLRSSASSSSKQRSSLTGFGATVHYPRLPLPHTVRRRSHRIKCESFVRWMVNDKTNHRRWNEGGVCVLCTVRYIKINHCI